MALESVKQQLFLIKNVISIIIAVDKRPVIIVFPLNTYNCDKIGFKSRLLHSIIKQRYTYYCKFRLKIISVFYSPIITREYHRPRQFDDSLRLIIGHRNPL